ncbi:MAG: type II secretion system protein [Candidatus Liptonbacteria bacterium]
MILARNNRKGFTLLEMVIYIAIFSITIMLVIVVFYRMMDSQDRNRGRLEVETEANFLMQKIRWAVNDTQSISLPAAGATSTQLTVTKTGYAQNPISFRLASSTLQISQGGGEYLTLSSQKTRVNSAVFEHLASTTNQKDGLTVTLNLAYGILTNAVPASTTIRVTYYLR